jgi:outer membrane protein
MEFIMKKLLFLLPVFMMAEDFTQISHLIDNSLKIKIQKQRIEISSQQIKTRKGLNYGSLDASYNYSHLKYNPIMKTNIPGMTQMKVGNKDNYTFELKYSYPLFTGFAVNSSIEKAKLQKIKEELNLKNIKRVLTLQSGEIYANIYALKAKLKALQKAKKAVISAVELSQALFKEGLLNSSSLEDIKAKKYEIDAKIANTKSQINLLLNLLSYILNKKITSISNLPDFEIVTPNFENRADVKAIKTALKIADKDIKLAKSKFYPQIALQAGIKREGTNAIIDKNDYQNIDKSYIALGVNYNIFSGGSDKATLEIAKIAKLSTITYYNDYLNNIKTEYKNDEFKLNSLNYQLKAALKEENARETYYYYMKDKFKEGLVSTTDLDYSISKLAEARANKSFIKSQIFFTKLKLKLNGGNDEN